MRVLLDTHAFLWFVGGDARLSGYARSLITDPANARLLSVGSLWEMAIKANLGRLRLELPFPELVERQVRGNAIDVLPVRPAHLDEVARLPLHHRDPFDPADHCAGGGGGDTGRLARRRVRAVPGDGALGRAVAPGGRGRQSGEGGRTVASPFPPGLADRLGTGLARRRQGEADARGPRR